MTVSAQTYPPINQTISFFRVSDLQRTRAFYERAFGLRLVFERDGKVLILQATGESFFGFVKGELPADQPRMGAITLVSSDVDDWSNASPNSASRRRGRRSSSRNSASTSSMSPIRTATRLKCWRCGPKAGRTRRNEEPVDGRGRLASSGHVRESRSRTRQIMPELSQRSPALVSSIKDDYDS